MRDQVYIIVNFKSPFDYSITGSLMEQPRDVFVFSGLFQVIGVTNIFSNGEYKQTLKLLRVPGQYDEPTPNNAPVVSPTSASGTSSRDGVPSRPVQDAPAQAINNATGQPGQPLDTTQLSNEAAGTLGATLAKQADGAAASTPADQAITGTATAAALSSQLTAAINNFAAAANTVSTTFSGTSNSIGSLSSTSFNSLDSTLSSVANLSSSTSTLLTSAKTTISALEGAVKTLSGGTDAALPRTVEIFGNAIQQKGTEQVYAQEKILSGVEPTGPRVISTNPVTSVNQAFPNATGTQLNQLPYNSADRTNIAADIRPGVFPLKPGRSTLEARTQAAITELNNAATQVRSFLNNSLTGQNAGTAQTALTSSVNTTNKLSSPARIETQGGTTSSNTINEVSYQSYSTQTTTTTVNQSSRTVTTVITQSRSTSTRPPTGKI